MSEVTSIHDAPSPREGYIAVSALRKIAEVLDDPHRPLIDRAMMALSLVKVGLGEKQSKGGRAA